jgi:hypothetical protein|tara:strand:- start:2887 stop:3090 length:204 start_codon:yes stop_codon:yes gene_type:complete
MNKGDKITYRNDITGEIKTGYIVKKICKTFTRQKIQKVSVQYLVSSNKNCDTKLGYFDIVFNSYIIK